MAPLVRFDAVSVIFGDQRVLSTPTSPSNPASALLDRAQWRRQIDDAEVDHRRQEPDDGAVEKPARLRWSLLEQELADESAELVGTYVARGMAASSHESRNSSA